MEFVRDPMWQFIGASLVFLSIIILIILHLANTRRKALSYKIIYKFSILKLKSDLHGKLKILYGRKPVSNIEAVFVKIINSGNLPILPADFQQPICLQIPAPGELLTMGIEETTPTKLDIAIEVKKNTVVVKPLLLNKGDSFTIKVIANELEDDINVDARIVGVAKIKQLKERIPRYAVVSFVSGILSGLLSAFVYLEIFGFPASLYTLVAFVILMSLLVIFRYVKSIRSRSS